jgi:poly-gamma-glutamate synthesis protein (capsule biosynthesis protein)
VTLAGLLVACGAPGGVQVRSGATTSDPDGATAAPSATTSAPGDGELSTPVQTAPPWRPRTFTVVGSGDVLLHSLLWRQGQRDAAAAGQSGYNFVPLLASVAPVVRGADLGICHIESQFGPPAGPFTDYPLFSVPPQIAPALATTGYETCSTASNHSLDDGEAGIDRTLGALDAAGIHHAGTARSAAEANTTDLVRANGVTVAQLSYAFGFNGLRLPPDKPWLANLIDPARILADAHRAKQAGADVVIVSMHWGNEYSHDLNAQQLSDARTLLASPDIDLILGTHTHVVQPIERIGDKWVVYGMGNEVAYQNQSLDTQDGIMPRFTFTEVSPGMFRVTKAEVLPIHMWLGQTVRLYDTTTAIADHSLPAAVRLSCQDSRNRTIAILGGRGAYQAGLVVI